MFQNQFLSPLVPVSYFNPGIKERDHKANGKTEIEK